MYWGSRRAAYIAMMVRRSDQAFSHAAIRKWQTKLELDHSREALEEAVSRHNALLGVKNVSMQQRLLP